QPARTDHLRAGPRPGARHRPGPGGIVRNRCRDCRPRRGDSRRCPGDRMSTVAPVQSLALILALTACGASRAPAQVSPPVASAADSSSDPALPPAGFGQFNQDVITLRLRSGSLEIRVVPLDERVLRLLSNDGYNSLRALVAGQQARIDSIARRAGVQEPGIALVTFFASTPNTRFD